MFLKRSHANIASLKRTQPPEVIVNRNELALAKARNTAQIVAQIVGLLKTCVTAGCIVLCIWLIMDGLQSMVKADAAAISALATVVEKLNISAIVGWIVGLAGVGYGVLERRGKKRLLPGYAAKRRKMEQNDPYHASSGLTESGDTP